MGITVSWHNASKTIIRWDYDLEWSIEDFVVASDEAIDLIASVSHHVDVIAVVSGQSIPAKLLPHIRRLFERYPDNTLIVTIEDNNYMRLLFQSIAPLLKLFTRQRIKVTTSPTIEAAESLIAVHANSLIVNAPMS